MQHKIAKKALVDHIEGGDSLPCDLSDKAEHIRNMLADTDFDQTAFDQNADYVQSFADVATKFDRVLIEQR